MAMTQAKTIVLAPGILFQIRVAISVASDLLRSFLEETEVQDPRNGRLALGLDDLGFSGTFTSVSGKDDNDMPPADSRLI
jgi:hypothetical protein